MQNHISHLKREISVVGVIFNSNNNKIELVLAMLIELGLPILIYLNH